PVEARRGGQPVTRTRPRPRAFVCDAARQRGSRTAILGCAQVADNARRRGEDVFSPNSVGNGGDWNPRWLVRRVGATVSEENPSPGDSPLQHTADRAYRTSARGLEGVWLRRR